jgi:hypothetical protein
VVAVKVIVKKLMRMSWNGMKIESDLENDCCLGTEIATSRPSCHYLETSNVISSSTFYMTDADLAIPNDFGIETAIENVPVDVDDGGNDGHLSLPSQVVSLQRVFQRTIRHTPTNTVT